MNQMIWLRTAGASVAAMLLLYAGLSIYADLARPEFRARDLFSGSIPPTLPNAPSPALANLLSVDADSLADYAALKAEQVLNRPSLNVAARAEENAAAQQALVEVLDISPIRPALWLALATLKAQRNEPIAPALKMSYLTGSVPVEVAFSRVQTVTSTSAASDEEIRLLAQSDIRATLAEKSRFEAPLVAAYVQATPEGKALLLDATRVLDPKFNAVLRRY